MGLRVAVVGLGRIGTLHAENLARHPEVSQVLLLGRDEGRVQTARTGLAQRLDLDGDPAARLRAGTDLDAGLAAADAVVVATSTPSHPALTRQAVAAGKPVLVEKPLALDVAELEALATELERQDCPVMVAFHRRYDPSHQALRREVGSGAAGPVRVVRASDHDRPALDLDYIPGSGGIWRDLLIHDFDIVPWLVDAPVQAVTAFGAVLDEPGFAERGDVDTAVAVLQLAGGALATVTAGRRNGSGQDVRLEVACSERTFGIGYDLPLPFTAFGPQAPPPAPGLADFVARFEPAFRAEIDHFVALAQGRAPNLTPPREGLAALRVAVAAQTSARLGRTVAVAGID